jgi:hypothetical protein
MVPTRNTMVTHVAENAVHDDSVTDLRFPCKRRTLFGVYTDINTMLPLENGGDLVRRRAMMRESYFAIGDAYSGPDDVELPGRGSPSVDRENIVELGDKARLEAERFINRNIDDSTMGWPVLARKPRNADAELDS